MRVCTMNRTSSASPRARRPRWAQAGRVAVLPFRRAALAIHFVLSHSSNLNCRPNGNTAANSSSNRKYSPAISRMAMALTRVDLLRAPPPLLPSARTQRNLPRSGNHFRLLTLKKTPSLLSPLPNHCQLMPKLRRLTAAAKRHICRRKSPNSPNLLTAHRPCPVTKTTLLTKSQRAKRRLGIV